VPLKKVLRQKIGEDYFGKNPNYTLDECVGVELTLNHQKWNINMIYQKSVINSIFANSWIKSLKILIRNSSGGMIKHEICSFVKINVTKRTNFCHKRATTS
jgi:hypothetical protein